MSAKASGMSHPIVPLAVAMTSLYPIITKGVTLDSLRNRFYHVRIVDGKTGRIVRCQPLMTPLFLEKSMKLLEDNEIMMVLEKGIWVPVRNKFKTETIQDLSAIYGVNPGMLTPADEKKLYCNACYGFGMWPDEYDERTNMQIPMTMEEAQEGHLSTACYWCGADNDYYWKNEGVSFSMPPIPVDKTKVFDSVLEDFVEKARCVEYSDTLETAKPDLPW